ncbi:MAG TPA: hypothetical protein VNA25_19585 [Phycisphaerae bacterium]|nr:hypothetical protein [Phycisphaerae bacterium]
MDRAERRRGLHLVSKGHKPLVAGALFKPDGSPIVKKLYRILVIPADEGVDDRGVEVIRWDALPAGTVFACSGENRDEALKNLEEMSRGMADQFPEAPGEEVEPS